MLRYESGVCHNSWQYLPKMNIDHLLDSQANADSIKKYVTENFMVVSTDQVKSFIDALTESKITYQNLSHTLTALTERLNKLDNLSEKLESFRVLKKFTEVKNVGDVTLLILEGFATALTQNQMYREAAQLIETFPEPESDREKLEHYLRIGENYLKGQSYDSAFSCLTRMAPYVFRLSTPKAILERYDSFRGQLHIHRSNFLVAGRAFMQIYNAPTNEDMQMYGLRLAMISSILAPATQSRLVLLSQIMDDDRAPSIDVYPMADLIYRNKFIDQIQRDNFRKLVQNEVDPQALNALDRSSLQHNLSVAQHMFSSVKIERLAQLVGGTPDNVGTQLCTMIRQNQLKATIDQPNQTVCFYLDESEKADSNDADILKYCQSVMEIADCINKI